jgi:amino acid transporter
LAEYTQHDKDRRILHALGYAQELRRGMSGFSNFAISFTIISVLSGTLTLYATGINYGGPIMEAWGWPLVSFFVLIVGLGMAEIASKYPDCGGLYYWSSKIGGPAWGWFTGWFDLIGQIAITAGIDYGAAIFTTALLNLLWPGTFPATPHTIIYVYAVILALHVLLNVFSVRLVAFLNDISVWWHLFGVTIIVGFLIFKPDNHQSVSTVFTHTINNSGFSHAWLWFVLLLGLLQAQYTYTGYDASAHMSEETKDASKAAARGLVMSIVVSAIFGYILALGVTFAIQSFTATTGAGIFPVKQVFLDALGSDVAKVMLFITVVAQFFCGMSSITSASRMMYAFSRDRAVPGNQLWRRLNRERVPYLAAVTLDRHDRPLPRLCDADLPAAPPGRQLGAGRVDARPLVQADRDRRVPLGRVHLDPLHPPDHADRSPVEQGLHLAVPQLRADRGPRHVAARRWLVAGVGAEVVQGPDRAGLGGRPRADRGTVRVGRQHPGDCGIDSAQDWSSRGSRFAGSLALRESGC